MLKQQFRMNERGISHEKRHNSFCDSGGSEPDAVRMFSQAHRIGAPARKPARTVEVKSDTVEHSPEPQPEIIEETYVVDAPDEAAAKPVIVEERELAEEPLPELTQAPASEPEAGAAEETTTQTEPGAQAEAEPAEPMGEMTDEAAEVVEAQETVPTVTENGLYYVQVGAFSDLENANRVLADLLTAGYKGSVLEKTGTGMFRVQAGAFADEDTAGDALEQLKTEYPNGFVFKKQ